jgi:hypothetical protein
VLDGRSVEVDGSNHVRVVDAAEEGKAISAIQVCVRACVRARGSGGGPRGVDSVCLCRVVCWCPAAAIHSVRASILPAGWPALEVSCASRQVHFLRLFQHTAYRNRRTHHCSMA